MQVVAAACFGAVLGWYLCVNMHRATHDAKDVALIATAMGAGAITKLPPDTLFGYYSFSLFLGCFGCALLSHVRPEPPGGRFAGSDDPR